MTVRDETDKTPDAWVRKLSTQVRRSRACEIERHLIHLARE